MLTFIPGIVLTYCKLIIPGSWGYSYTSILRGVRRDNERGTYIRGGLKPGGELKSGSLRYVALNRSVTTLSLKRNY